MATATFPTTARRTGIVLYDGTCPLCQRSVAILRRLDWRKALSFHDARDPANLPMAKTPLVRKRLLEEMHVVTPTGEVFAGFAAFRWIAGVLPPLMMVWPLLFLPGVPALGQRAYLWVAKNRYNLVPCKDGVCQLPAARGRTPAAPQ